MVLVFLYGSFCIPKKMHKFEDCITCKEHMHKRVKNIGVFPISGLYEKCTINRTRYTIVLAQREGLA